MLAARNKRLGSQVKSETRSILWRSYVVTLSSAVLREVHPFGMCEEIHHRVRLTKASLENTALHIQKLPSHPYYRLVEHTVIYAHSSAGQQFRFLCVLKYPAQSLQMIIQFWEQ